MQLPVRWLLLVAAGFLLTPADAAPKPNADDIEHMREELGVNEFTAPSIDIILRNSTP